MMARRATSLNAMFCVDNWGAVATATQCAIRCGYKVVQASACMPPRLPPITAAKRSMPNASASRAWACTQSSTVSTGKSGP